MRYMVGKMGLPQLRQVQRDIDNVGMILSPCNGWQNPTCPYGCDNGVYGAWSQGKVWDQKMHEDWMTMLNKIPSDNPPMWVLLPDAVADWPRTVELARLYLPLVRQKGFKVNIALQDGCDFEEMLGFSPEWVFVAGSTEWKERNIHRVCEFFHGHGIKVHVGRVNTARRLMLCQSAGVDSVDGTTLNKYRDSTLPLVSNTLRQPCFQL